MIMFTSTFDDGGMEIDDFAPALINFTVPIDEFHLEHDHVHSHVR